MSEDGIWVGMLWERGGDDGGVRFEVFGGEKMVVYMGEWCVVECEEFGGVGRSVEPYLFVGGGWIWVLKTLVLTRLIWDGIAR